MLFADYAARYSFIFPYYTGDATFCRHLRRCYAAMRHYCCRAADITDVDADVFSRFSPLFHASTHEDIFACRRRQH